MNWKGFERVLSQYLIGAQSQDLLGRDQIKPRKNLSQYSWCPGQDSNQARTEYESGVLPLDRAARENEKYRR
jgi:hypothetical protein